MDTPSLVVVHVNPSLAHQVEHGRAWAAGLGRHGVRVHVTADATMPGDVHILSGPNYALRHWTAHPRTVLLDVAHYGCQKTSFSIGWLNPDGSRHFPRSSAARSLPPTMPQRLGAKTLVLGDYNQDRSEVLRLLMRLGPVSFRPHPRDAWAPDNISIEDGPLEQVLARYDRAHGWRSSALTAAALAGLEPVPEWDGHFCAWLSLRKFSAWCQDLAWMHWTLAEIENGNCWEWLRATETNRHAVGGFAAA